MAKLTLSDIKARSTGYFFSKKAMDFFSSSNWPGAKCSTRYAAKYDETTGLNYVVVTDPWGNKHYHRFNESDGSLSTIMDDEIPENFRRV